MFGKLKKLRGRSLAEIKDRGRQTASVLAERFGVSAQTRIPRDEKFAAMFDLDGKAWSAETVLQIATS